MKESEKSITREMLESAMKQFLSKGGKIHVLPEHHVISGNLIIGSDAEAYESTEEFDYFPAV